MSILLFLEGHNLLDRLPRPPAKNEITQIRASKAATMKASES